MSIADLKILLLELKFVSQKVLGRMPRDVGRSSTWWVALELSFLASASTAEFGS